MEPEKKGLVPMVNFMNKIPGGIMLIPLLVGCAINSFFPGFLQIGGATTGVFTSTNAFLGAFFVCVGANLSISGAGKALKVGAMTTCWACPPWPSSPVCPTPTAACSPC